ncbi:MAG: HNH endonuclease [Acidimicrobiia bacterium]|nr:HNH endonuclease [Acidimicrobiia bacterium]
MPRAAALRSTIPVTGRAARGGDPAGVEVQLADLAARAEELLAAVVPERLEGDAVLSVLGSFSRLRRVGSAGEVLAAGRVEELGLYRRAGQGSTAALIASRSGTSPARAGEVVETAKRLGTCPGTRQALVSGAVSVEQAHAITAAATVVPDAEAGLLALAGRETLRTLQERARDVRLEAEADRLGRYRRQHAARSLVHGRDDEGMVWGRFRLPRMWGRRWWAASSTRPTPSSAPPTGKDGGRGTIATSPTRSSPSSPPGPGDPCWRGGRRGRPGGPVDGCVAAGAPGRRGGPRVVRGVAARGRRRRRAVHGPGGRADPLERARELMDDAFLTGVLVEGSEVQKVRRFGRRVPAELRTALEVRGVLRDGDVVCAEPSCDRRLGLEWDHADPHAHGGPTSYDNIQALCREHHRQKSARDRARPGRRSTRQSGRGARSSRARAGPDPP